MQQLLRALPSVDACLAALCKADSAVALYPRPLVKEAVNIYLQARREAIRQQKIGTPEELSLERLLPAMLKACHQHAGPHLRRVINATGVVLHTNMGRAMLAPEAVEAVNTVAAHYSNLELDLDTGERGSRYSHVEALVCRLSGAEAAIAVNNNAAAVLLILSALCAHKEVVLARGQLVEIGGSFRIPDVMAQSGASLHEVGCTNRVHLADYEQAINENTAALMRVHTSNYRVIGFHSEVGVTELAALAARHHIPLIENLGSGGLLDLSPYGLHGEPTARAVLEQGASLVCFSGDKVLGGPQAGLIAGKRELVEKIKKHPLTRAVRVDKFTLAALEATLRLYLQPELALERIPTLAMLTISREALAKKAASMLRLLRTTLKGLARCRLAEGSSRVGGGAFPEQELPTQLIAVQPNTVSAQKLKQRLLAVSPPVVARLEEGMLLFDPRTISLEEARSISRSLHTLLAV